MFQNQVQTEGLGGEHAAFSFQLSVILQNAPHPSAKYEENWDE